MKQKYYSYYTMCHGTVPYADHSVNRCHFEGGYSCVCSYTLCFGNCAGQFPVGATVRSQPVISILSMARGVVPRTWWQVSDVPHVHVFITHTLTHIYSHHSFIMIMTALLKTEAGNRYDISRSETNARSLVTNAQRHILMSPQYKNDNYTLGPAYNQSCPEWSCCCVHSVV